MRSEEVAKLTPDEAMHLYLLQIIVQCSSEENEKCEKCDGRAEFNHPKLFCRKHWAEWWADGMGNPDKVIEEVYNVLDR